MKIKQEGLSDLVMRELAYMGELLNSNWSREYIIRISISQSLSFIYKE